MSNITVTLSVPYSNEASTEANISTSSTINSVFQRATHIYQGLQNIFSYEILIQLTDGTYTFGKEEEAIGNFSLPKDPKIILVPKEFEVEIAYETLKPFKVLVSARESTASIVKRVSEQIGTINPDNYILVDGNIPLIDTLSIVEQKPGITKLKIVDASSDDIKVKFMDVYLRGNVYLSYSDALNLSAYLLQATKGPSRCYNGSASGLNKYLPKRLQTIPGAGDELMLHWSFLSDITRDEAIRKFTEKVQVLPLFNCTSFSGERIKKDKTSNLPSEFELILTDKRMIFLDFKLFKTRISITYRDLISIERDDDEIEITYYESGEEKQVKFETDTSKSLLKKVIEVVKSEKDADEFEISGSEQTCNFHSMNEIKEDNKRIEFFPSEFVYNFVNIDEKETKISYFELMHALLIRADSCAFHLSVLLSKVNKNNTKVIKDELIEYYRRMMAYLTYITYDHRPFDVAIDLGPLLLDLEENIKNANDIIQEVVKKLNSAKQMFVPISSDAIYVSSNNVIAYVLSNLLSYSEFKYATKEPESDQFEEVNNKFYANFLQMREYIYKYMFSVGAVDFKGDLQKTLDFVFTHFLQSLNKLTIIAKDSKLGQLDPTIIMHQDSCNITMENIVGYSHLIWADRKAISTEHLEKFLEQAELLAKSLLEDTTKYNIHVSAISQFLKICKLNLPALSSTFKTIFTHFVVYAERFISTYELVQSFEYPHMMFKLLQIASLLVIAQPEKHANEIQIILNQLQRICKESYNKIVEDLPTFDLLLEEGRNPNIAALRCYVVENLKKADDSKQIPQIMEETLPLFALQQSIDRNASEWSPKFMNMFIWQSMFIQAYSSHMIYKLHNDICDKKINVSDSLKKSIEDMKFDEGSLWLPELTCEKLQNATKVLEQDSQNFGEIANLIKIGTQCYYGFKVPKITSHEQVKIYLDSACYIAQNTFNSVSISLKHDVSTAMTSFAPLYLSSKYMLALLREVALQPSYFTVPAIYLKQKKIMESMNYGAESFFSSFNMNQAYITNIYSFGEIIKTIADITATNDLTILYPIVKFDFTQTINSNEVSSHRIDLTDLICDYRTLKNDLVECLLLNEKSSLEIIANKISEVATNIISLLNYVDSGNNINKKIADGYQKFAEKLPMIFTYRLSSIHLRESLDPLDTGIDESIDYIAVKLYEVVSINKVRELISTIEGRTYEPKERNTFVKSFVSAIKEIISKNSEMDEESVQLFNEILMLIEDNEIYEIKSLLKSSTEEYNSLLDIIKKSDYCKYIIKIEKANDEIQFSDTYIWYKQITKDISKALKKGDVNENSAEGMKILSENLEPVDIKAIEKNIKEASTKIILDDVEKLSKECDKVISYLKKLESDYKTFINTITAKSTRYGAGIIYQDTIQQIVHLFYIEYCLQSWDNESFEELCKISTKPNETQYSSDSVADSLIFARRLMRKLRLTKPTVQAEFITKTDMLLSSTEKSLREFYAGAQKSSMEVLKKQKEVVDGYVEQFKKLKDGQIKKFVVRLMNNLSLDIATMDTFNSTAISKDVALLFEELNSSIDKSVQIRALIHFVESIEHSVLPVDYDRLLDILHKLLESMNEKEGEIFDYEQDAKIELAIKLSDSLGQLYSIKKSLNLIKEFHKLYNIKEKLFNLVNTIIRTNESYAEEITIFKSTNHPIIGLIKTIPKMCESLTILIENSFMLKLTQENINDVLKSMEDFENSCPKEISTTMQTEIQEAMEIIKGLKE